VATRLLNDFPPIMFGLLVEIGGSIPGEDEDNIRLGDVVGKPTLTLCEMTREKSRPVLWAHRNIEEIPPVLTASAQQLWSRRIRSGSLIPTYLSEMLEEFPNMREEQYVYQGSDHDQLFEVTIFPSRRQHLSEM
jgi:hypothetical protein